MKLYYWPKTRAFRALWMLEELRVPYEFAFVNIRAGAQNEPEFCRVNPMCKLPALDDDGVCVAESGAVLLYLADRFPGAQLGAPPDDPQRGRFLQWMFFTGACLEPAMAERMTGAPGNTVSFGWGDLVRVEHAVEAALKDGPWLLGERFTAADVLWATALRWTTMFKLVPESPVVAGYIGRVTSRPAFARAAKIDADLLAAQNAG